MGRSRHGNKGRLSSEDGEHGRKEQNSALAQPMAVQDNTLCKRIRTTRQAIGTAGEHFM